MKKCIGIITALWLTCILMSLGAQDQAQSSSINLGFELGLGIETLQKDPKDATSQENQQSYQKLSFMPDISFGKFGIGLDLTMHFTIHPGQSGSDFEIYEPDWIPEKAGKTFLELYLPKFAYIRWGQKGDSLYAKLGAFNDGTLGNGFIMGYYSNTRFLPEQRNFGMALDVDGTLFKFPYLGLESFAGNLANFDVLGTRLYARPLIKQNIGLFQKLQIGITAASDLDPYRYAGDVFIDTHEDTEGINIFGIDGKMPILNTPMSTLNAFSDVAFQPRGRWGTMVGVGGSALGFLLYGAQLRLLGPDFIPTYFDGSYDLFRHLKYQSMLEDPSGDLYAGWLASLGFSLFSNIVVINAALDGPFASAPDDPGIADYPHLRASLKLGEGLLGGFSFDTLYEKYYLGAKAPQGTGSFWEDLVSRENAYIGASINYHTGPAIISLIYNLRYDPTSGSYVVTSSLMSSVRF